MAEKACRPVIALVCPDATLVDASGAMHALRCQIEALKGLGTEPVLVVAAPSVRPSGRISAAKRDVIEGRARELAVPVAALVSAPRTPAAGPALARTALRILLRRPFGPEADVDLARLARPGAHLTFGIAPAAVIANNVSSALVADCLAPRSHQLLVLHYLPMSAFSRRFASMLDGRQHIMALSHDEAATLRRLLPDTAVHVGLQVRPETIREAKAGAGPDAPRYESLAAALAASGPQREPAGGWRASGWECGGVADLLFVGDAHAANVAGLRAFITECFLPQLAPKGVTLVVAGAVAAGVEDIARHPSIALLGYCRSLDPLYAVARLVVVPLLSGDGSPTKTIEAIAKGKAVAATPVGLRGLGALADFALPPRFGEGWSCQILALLANGQAREELAQALSAHMTGPSIAASLAHLLPRLLRGEATRPLPPRPMVDEARKS